MGRIKYPKRRKFTPVDQYVFLNNSTLVKGKGMVRRNILTWDFQAQPTPLSRVYSIRIIFNGRSPKIYVITPQITEIAVGKKIPHLYDQEKQQLCLYYPKHGEWTVYDKISESVVMWVFLWLYYFEIWLMIGRWEGGGKEPEPKIKKKKKQSEARD